MRRTQQILIVASVLCFYAALLLAVTLFPPHYNTYQMWVRLTPAVWEAYALLLGVLVTLLLAAYSCMTLALLTQ